MVRCQISGEKPEVDALVEQLKSYFDGLAVSGECRNESTLFTRKFVAIKLTGQKK